MYLFVWSGTSLVANFMLIEQQIFLIFTIKSKLSFLHHAIFFRQPGLGILEWLFIVS